MRLIDEEGQVVGIMSSGQALAIAREKGVDLVEVSPMANPPVCRLMDWGRFKYEQAKKENEARKHQKIVELKEIRMKPRTDKADLDVKVRKIIEFLGEGDKVKVSVIFRGREMAHPELGRAVLDRVVNELKGVAQIERPAIQEGRMISMLVSRAPGWEPAKKAAPAPTAKKADRIADGAETETEAETEEAGNVEESAVNTEAAAPEQQPAPTA